MGRDERTRIVRCLADFTLDPHHHFCCAGFSVFFLISIGRVRDILRLSRWCNPGEYVKIMLAVWCFMVFAAVGERLAVSGKRERRERV